MSREEGERGGRGRRKKEEGLMGFERSVLTDAAVLCVDIRKALRKCGKSEEIPVGLIKNPYAYEDFFKFRLLSEVDNSLVDLKEQLKWNSHLSMLIKVKMCVILGRMGGGDEAVRRLAKMYAVLKEVREDSNYSEWEKGDWRFFIKNQNKSKE
jgi:hypothetical protein